jgi:FtsH-binding integral membrane protein
MVRAARIPQLFVGTLVAMGVGMQPLQPRPAPPFLPTVDSGNDTVRSFMAGTYRWMVLGLAVTGGAVLVIGLSPPLALLAAKLRWLLFFAQLGVVFAFSFLLRRLPAPAAGAMFLFYALLVGATFSGLLFAVGPALVGQAFFVSAGAFAGLSLWASVTKRDLSGWGTFLLVGLIGIVLAGVVNLFVGSGMIAFVASCAGVVVFGGLTAYDTQRLRALAAEGHGTPTRAIHGALMLYLDFINLFLSVLSLSSGRRR